MARPDALLPQLEHSYGVMLSAEQRRQVRAYLELLEEWNRRTNLTGLKSAEERLRFHFFESFWSAQHFLSEKETALADVGSGAGFPGLAIKLYRPELAVTLLERKLKKVVFLKEASRRLGLAVEIFEGEAEAYPGWDRMAVATMRALKPSRQLLEILSLHGVKVLLLGGREASGRLPQFEILRQEKLPASHNRWATLLAPHKLAGSACGQPT